MSLAYQVYDQTNGRIYLNPGETKEVFIKLKNTGTESWSKTGSNPVRLGTANPHDRASGFYKSGNLGWLSNSRIEFEEAGPIATNQFATFRFEITAVENSAQYREYYTPVKEGVAWMTPDPSPYLDFDNRAIVTTAFGWYVGLDPAVREGHHWEGIIGGHKTTDIPKLGGDVPDGFYNSLDDEVIARQLELIDAAGINCIGLDFAGHSDISATWIEKFRTAIETNYPNMRFFFFIDNPQDWSQTQFNYIYHFAGSPNQMKYDGKPLLTCFGPAGGSDSSNRFTYYAMGANDQTNSWCYWNFEVFNVSPIRNAGGTVIARYDDGPTGQGPFPRSGVQEHDQMMDEGMFDSQFGTVKTAWQSSTLNTLRIAFFNAWNEYHERISIFEPHEDRNIAGATSPAVSDTFAYDKLQTAIEELKT